MDADRAFRAAWARFGDACAETVAPEATYQAWFAHFLMEDFGVLRVVREVDFGSRHLDPSDQDRFPGHNLMVDVMVLREAVVDLPRRAWLGGPPSGDGPDPRSGLGRLGQFAIISELKVGATQGEGLGHSQILRDVHKLDALLRAAQDQHPDQPLPLAYACVLDNHPTRRLNREHLAKRLASEVPGSPVAVLLCPLSQSPRRPG